MVDSLLEIVIERGSQLYKPIDVHSDKCCRPDWGEHDFSCGHTFFAGRY